jgi:hypothetical protein
MLRDPRRVPAANGFAWLAQSLTLVRRQAARLLLLALLMQLVLGLTQLPLVGLLIILSVPALNAGLLEAFHVTARDGRPELRLLFRPLASGAHVGRLFAMGALVFAVGVIHPRRCPAARVLDPALLERIEQGTDAMSSLNLNRWAAWLAFLVGIAISGTLERFRDPLTWFHDRKLGAALGTGCRRCSSTGSLPGAWRGAGAVVLRWIVSGALFTLAAGGGLMTAVVMGLILVLLLFFQLMLFATQYCAFRDIFGLPAETAPPPESGGDDQLVA